MKKTFFSSYLFSMLIFPLNSMENSKNGLTLHSDALPASWAPELTAVFNQRKPIDISYLDTPQGSEHLRKINSILVKNGLHITIERENSMATLSINLFAPGEDEDSYTLLSLFSLSRPLATNDVPGEILLPEHLNEMVNVARLMGATPEITKPIKEDYLKRMATMKVPLRTKMLRAWDDEIKPSIAHQSAQLIGKELAKACLIALGAAEDVQPIQADWEKKLRDRVESLNTDEIEVQKFLFLIKYSELKSTSVKQDDFFNTTYEQLIDSGQGATR